MSSKMVFRSLQEVFPQVDLRILKAVAIEHSKDVDAAVEFVLYEVLPSLNEPTEGSYNIDDTHARENSPVELGVQDTFWDNHGAEGENTNLIPGLEGNCASLDPNAQGMYGTEATPNETAVCTPAPNFPSPVEDMDFLIKCEETVARGFSKSDDILAFSNLEISTSCPDAVTPAQDIPSSVSGDTLNLERGVNKVNQSSLSVFEEQHSKDIFENCSESVALDISSVAEKLALVGTQSGNVLGMDILEDFASDVKRNKETLVIDFESVNKMVKDVELHEDRANQAREEASRSGHEILTKAEDMKQMLIHAKEAKEMQAAEVDAEKSLLATKSQELQSRILILAEQSEISLSIIEEIHQSLENRLAAAKEVQTAAEQEKLEKEEVARKILNEQEVIMEEILQESKRLQQESQENAKLRDFLMDRSRIVDILQREMAVICEDVILFKERMNGHAYLPKSPPLTNSSLASSSSSSSSFRSLSKRSLHTLELGGSPKSTTEEPLRNEQLGNDSNDNREIGVGHRGDKALSDDDWELFELQG